MVSQEIENLGLPLGLGAAEVREAIGDPEYMETIEDLMYTTRSPAKLKKRVETYPRREMPAELAERFGVSEKDMSELIGRVEDWLTSRT